MLNKKEIMDRYALIRQFTAQYSGLNVILIENYLKEITETCIKSLELLKSNNISIQ